MGKYKCRIAFRYVFFILSLCMVACMRKVCNEELYFFIPDGSECFSLVESDSLKNETRYHYRNIGNNRVAAIVDQYLINLTDTSSHTFHIPFDGTISDIKWKDGECFFSSDSTLYHMDGNAAIRPIIIADGEITHIELCNDGIAFVKDSLLAYFSFHDKKVETILHAGSVITGIKTNEQSFLFSAGNDIFIYDAGQTYRVYSAESGIMSFDINSNGIIFYSTNEAVIFITPDLEMNKIVNKAASEITVIDNNIYIIFTDNSSCMITNATLFDNLNS